MQKVLILGANGLLGQNFIKRFQDTYEIVASSVEGECYSEIDGLNYQQADLTKRMQIQGLIADTKPDIIINTAAYTNVDGCEDHQKDCWNVNVHAVENILESNFRKKPLLVQISTDYVFDGEQGYYREIDPTNPRGNYARSKMAAENIIRAAELEYLIVRIQVLYGFGRRIRLNFVTWVVDQLSKGKTIHVVDDQIGNPTYAPDVCEGVFRLLQKQAYGLFHISGAETLSRYDFALKIAQVFNLDQARIQRCKTAQLRQKSPRPMDSSFVLDKLINNTGWEPHDVESALKLFKIELRGKND